MSDPITPPPSVSEAAWIAAQGFEVTAVEPLAGDVGSRRYRRLTLADGGTALLVRHRGDEAERLAADCRRFVATSALLAAAGVAVPRVLGADCAAGRLLVEDAGPETLDRWAVSRPWPEVEVRLRAAVATARCIGALASGEVAHLSPPLDRALLRRELALTEERFLGPRGALDDAIFAHHLGEAFDALAAAVAAPPPVVCHRDYMVRNLLPRGDDGVTVIDHQDLRLGPPLYDLASLLNDTLFPPRSLETELLAEWGLGAEGKVDYHRVAAQRTLKALGSYAMAAEAGNRKRLPLVVPTLARALEHLAAAPETAEMAGELRRRVGKM
ncbi:MAG TPA: phosphotransferase [Thermoanaerobaculia bacterium]|nr:phosphotransferase [Thermoanaerobaculia bacterium]